MSDSLRVDDQTEIVREHERDPERASEAERLEAIAQGARQGVRIGLLTGALICTVAIWLFVAWRTPSDADATAQCMREHAGFIDIKASCTEPVGIERHGDLILAHPGTALEERGLELRVRQGKASFVAHQRTDGTKLLVVVSHGSIEVTGARFTVVQNEQDGRVSLEEGTIVFHDSSGGEVTLAAGTELTWPRDKSGDVVALGAIPLVVPEAAPKPATPMPAAPKPATPKAASSKPVTPKPVAPPQAAAAPVVEEEEEEAAAEPIGPMSMEDILKKISTLRSQHRTREAVELLLANSKRGDITDAQMSRLSWEIGLFLQESASDKASACNHWKTHARKYPDDAAHAERVQEFIRVCETPL